MFVFFKQYMLSVILRYFDRDCLNPQLKSFGAKLKERNSFFRKTGKAQSHEMKEDLYSNLVQANLVRVVTEICNNNNNIGDCCHY